MTITLSNANVPARTLRNGTGSFTLAAGETLKIEGTDDILEVEVPEGKQWAVSLGISIVETDAE